MIRKSVQRFSDEIMPIERFDLTNFKTLFTHFAPAGVDHDNRREVLCSFRRRIVLEAWV